MSFKKCLFRPLTHFKVKLLFVVLLLSFRSSSYTLHIASLCTCMCLTNIQCLTCLCLQEEMGLVSRQSSRLTWPVLSGLSWVSAPASVPLPWNPFFLALASADSAFYTFSASAFILLCFLFLYLSFLLLLLATYSFAVFMYAHSMHVCAHMHTFNIYVEVRGQLGNWFSSHHQVGARD
jgi:hypothetical protein